MAEVMGISASSVGRIWAQAGLKPHLIRGFKVTWPGKVAAFMATEVADEVERILHAGANGATSDHRGRDPAEAAG